MNSETTIPPAEDPATLRRILEAVLFVADTPLEPSILAELTGVKTREVEKALEALQVELEEGALRLQYFRGRVQLVTAPEFAPWIERFMGLDLSGKLSTAALETLAIVAYRQPITRAEIDAIRGVNSSGTIRTLIQRELIEEVNRLETVGNPYQYGTTPLFLQYFGLTSLDELPPLPADEAAKLLTELEDDAGSDS